MRECYLKIYRIATKANITPIATITNEPTVPPMVTVILFDGGDLIRFEDSREIKKKTPLTCRLSYVSLVKISGYKIYLKRVSFENTLE